MSDEEEIKYDIESVGARVRNHVVVNTDWPMNGHTDARMLCNTVSHAAHSIYEALGDDRSWTSENVRRVTQKSVETIALKFLEVLKKKRKL